jgi:hypothetical protein
MKATTAKRLADLERQEDTPPEAWPPAPIGARYYTLTDDGARVYVAASADEKAIEDKIHRLIYGTPS